MVAFSCLYEISCFGRRGHIVRCKLSSPRKLCYLPDYGHICELCTPMVARLYIKHTANDVATQNFVVVTLNVQVGVQRNLMNRHSSPSLYQCTVHNSLPLYQYCVCLFWLDSPQWTRASLFTRFLDHTQRRCTVGRTPLDE